jgi:hypothetical protein
MLNSAGLCWGLASDPDPTVDVNLGVTTDGYTGQFFSSLSGLTVGTSYKVRAYATNTSGTAYGDAVVFTATAATIGQVIQGGFLYGNVFSVDGTGTHGLIAYPWEYLSTDWGCASTMAGTGTAVGDGFTNTANIINDITTNGCTSANVTYNAFAPQVCQWFGADWYLPSKDEFALMLTNQVAAGLDAGLSSGTYPVWSSSEADATHVWVYDGTTWVNTALKTDQNMTWVIRSF